MSARPDPPRRSRPRSRSSSGPVAVWLIALLVALVATVQLRSQAEVERSLVQADPATLAFSIDQLSRSNDQLEAQIADLNQRRAALQSGGSTAADQVLQSELEQLRVAEGLVPVHGPGVVLVVDASGLTALDLQDAMNNLAAGGGEALAVNDQRVVAGVPIVQTANGVTVGGVLTPAPWTILAIGDSNRLAETADVMTQQLRSDRRVRQATYRVESDIVIRAVVSERPFVYAVP
jgi:uncharacterized protein YlxW (UPF0749 family)